MDDPTMDHRDRLRQNLDVLGAERLDSFKALDEFGAVVDKKFPVHAISTKRLLHIFVSWLYDRLTDIDLSDEHAARDEIRKWHAYLRGCYIADHLIADAFTDWTKEHVKVDRSSSRRLSFASAELDEILKSEHHRNDENRPIRIPRNESNDEHPSHSNCDSISPQSVNQAGPPSVVDDGRNGLYFFDTVRPSRSVDNEPATRSGEPKAVDNHWGAIHPDRLLQSRKEAQDPPYPSGGGDLMHNEPSKNDLSFLTGANQLAYMDSAELTSRGRSDSRRIPAVHNSPGRFSTSRGVTNKRGSSPSDESKLPKESDRSRMNRNHSQNACMRCKRPGHLTKHCPTSLDPRYDATPQGDYVCSWCNKPGHYSTVCRRNTLEDSLNQRRLRAGIIHHTTLDSAFRSEPGRDGRIRDRGDDRHVSRRPPPRIDEPRRGGRKARPIDHYRPYRSRSPPGDRYRSRRSPGDGRGRYARSRSPRSIEQRYRYDAALRSRQHRLTPPDFNSIPRQHVINTNAERHAGGRLTPPSFKSLREPVGNTNTGGGYQEHQPREREHREREREHREREPREPREPWEREANSNMTAPGFKRILRQTVSNTITEGRYQERKPRDREAARAFEGILPPDNKPNADDCFQELKPREQEANDDAVEDCPQESKPDTEDCSEENKPSEREANAKTPALDFDSILRQFVSNTDENRPDARPVPKRAPRNFLGDSNFAIYDAELDEALDELIADATNSGQSNRYATDWDNTGGRMLSVLSLDEASVPERKMPASVELGVTVKSLDGDSRYHPMVRDLFRDRPNVWLHKVTRMRVKDYWASTLQAEPDSHENDLWALALKSPPKNPILIMVEPADLDIDPYFYGFPDDTSARYQSDTNMAGDAAVQQANAYTSDSAVGLEASEEGFILGATNEVGDDSFTDKGDSVVGDMLPLEMPLESPNGVGEDDSFAEKGDSVMEDMLPLELPNGVGKDDTFAEEGDSIMEDMLPLELNNRGVGKDDSSAERGDSAVGVNLPPKVPNEVGGDDSFTEKGDSIMEDVDSLQLEKVEYGEDGTV